MELDLNIEDWSRIDDNEESYFESNMSCDQMADQIELNTFTYEV